MPAPRYSATKYMGRVLIVKNQKFPNGKLDRGGKVEDEKVEEMRATLMKMGFTGTSIEVVENKTKSEIIQLLQKIAAERVSRDDYCFICIVLSYGQDGVIICCDDTQSPKTPTASMQLPVSELQECLKGDKCKNLLLKPKIFMLQLERVPSDKRDGPPAPTVAPKPVKIPREADFLVYTCENDHALKTWIEGFRQYVLEPEQPKHPLEIQKLLTRMNRLYCEFHKDQGITYDTPCVTSLLTREAYLKKEEPSPI